MKKILLTGLLILLLAAQALQPPQNGGTASGPDDITRAVSVPPDVLAVLKQSCYDCHSNHTRYPWFDRITPVNWWVATHVKYGKLELNFTGFGQYSAKKQLNKLKKIRKTVEEGDMPLRPYLLMHRGARLTEAQKSRLLDWTRKASDEISQRPPAPQPF